MANVWQPGRSANPGGRPRGYASVAALAREHTEAAIDTLATLMHDDTQKGSTRVAAAQVLLERAWGKPREVTPEGEVDVTRMSNEQLLALIERAAHFIPPAIEVKPEKATIDALDDI
jgi:hypothetical protein